jgi:hypothetical protein
MPAKYALLLSVTIVCLAGVLADVEQFPDCIDRMIEPLRASTEHGQYESTDGSATQTHMWFCPIGAGTTHYVDFWKCEGDSVDRNCELSEGTFDEFWRLRNMKTCAADADSMNLENRVKACKPWENDGAMKHLRRQFPWLQTDKSEDPPVRPCEAPRDDRVEFSDIACWYDKDDMIFLKPQYKFSFRSGGRKQVCMISNNAVADVGSPSYQGYVLDYRPQADGTRQWSNCKYMGKNPGDEWMKYVLPFVYMLLEDTWQTRKIQFYDYRLFSGVKPCLDSVTESCFDNAFSFFGKACAWATDSAIQNGLTLAYLLKTKTQSDSENMVNYGDGRFVLRFQARHTRVLVSMSGGRADAADVFEWDGGAVALGLHARLHISARAGHSCNGCVETGYALTRGVTKEECGVPQQCVRCEMSQYVLASGVRSPCDASVADRTCVECPQHRMRSSTDEKACVACAALTPMRISGAVSCSACTVGQYFDARTTDGCANFESVAQGLVFTDSVLFRMSYVDKYLPTRSMDPPEAVPAKHYRNTVSAGNSWNASTTAQKCEPSFFVYYNTSVERILTRNMGAMEMQYRSWCGHEEILKYDNAVVESLECSSEDIERTVSTLALSPRNADVLRSVTMRGSKTSLKNLTSSLSVSLGGSNKYVLTYEHKVTDNRVAEVKLKTGVLTCYYEIRREGRTDNCRFCPGIDYTKDCGPTYHPELDTPEQTGPGVCVQCETRCFSTDHFFAVSQFSCWSNGTARVHSQGVDANDNLLTITQTMLTSMNHWYKPAACLPCAKLSGTSVPAIVTRCGNKAWFEMWHPSAEAIVVQVARPRRRFCCSLDRVVNTAGLSYDKTLGSSCVDDEKDIGLLTSTATPLCNPFVADLKTQYAKFCPPGWFLDRKVPGCGGVLGEWKQVCCSKCFDCKAQGMIKTNTYQVCPGDTDYDTQLLNCVTTCAERNYLVNDTCIACESCA